MLGYLILRVMLEVWDAGPVLIQGQEHFTIYVGGAINYIGVIVAAVNYCDRGKYSFTNSMAYLIGYKLGQC